MLQVIWKWNFTTSTTKHIRKAYYWKKLEDQCPSNLQHHWNPHFTAPITNLLCTQIVQRVTIFLTELNAAYQIFTETSFHWRPVQHQQRQRQQQREVAHQLAPPMNLSVTRKFLIFVSGYKVSIYFEYFIYINYRK